MSNLRGSLLLVVTLFAVVHVAPAQALPTSYVDPKLGSDGSACTITAPCKSVNKALTVTDLNGTVLIVGDGVINTGPVTITKGLAISGKGHEAFFQQASGNAVTVNVGTTDTVTLKDIAFSGKGTGNGAIYVPSVGKLVLKGVSEVGFVYGLYFTPGGASQGHLFVQDSDLRGNENLNVLIAPTGSGGAFAVFKNVKFHHSNVGLQIDGTKGTGMVQGTVSDSTLSFYNNIAVSVTSGPTPNGNSSANVTLERTVISNSPSYGIFTTGAGAQVTINDCTLTHLGVGIHITSGRVSTLRNNMIGATTPVQGTLTPANQF